MPEAVAGKLSPATKKSLLSVLVQSHYKIELSQKVGRQFFEPPPKIDSQIVVLKLSPAFKACSNKQWADLVKLFKLSFSHPRKQLATNLRAKARIWMPRRLAKLWLIYRFKARPAPENLITGNGGSFSWLFSA